MKNVGVLTFHNAINNGAFLQSFALVKYLNMNFQCSAEIIDYHSKNLLDANKPVIMIGESINEKAKTFISSLIMFNERRKVQSKFLDYINKESIKSKPCNKQNIETILERYDVLVVGSDQVWNPKIIKDDDVYFFNNLGDCKVKISYAASLGPVTDDNWISLSNFLNGKFSGFTGISVREESALKVLHNIGIKNAEVNVDPTLLLSSTDYDELNEGINDRVECEKYILLYRVLKPCIMFEYAVKLAAQKGLKIVCLNASLTERIKYRNIIHYYNVTPDIFLKLIKNAEYVLTTSFHCVTFSLIYNKNFMTEVKAMNGFNTRVHDLLDKLELTDRELDYQTRLIDIDQEINWNNVNDKIEVLREKAREYFNRFI